MKMSETTREVWLPPTIAGLNLFVMSMPFVQPSARIITHANVKMDSKETALFVLI